MTISAETAAGVRVLIIDAPPVNALNVADLTTLNAEFRDPVAGVIVLGAAGKHFSAGSDVRELSRLDVPGRAAAAALSGDLLESIANCRALTVAALRGSVLGTGLMVAAVCDLRIATTGTIFRLPEVTANMFAGYSSVRRALPRAEAVWLAVTGAPLTAQRAHELGLVQELVDGDSLDRARNLAAELITTGLPDTARGLGALLRKVDAQDLLPGYQAEVDFAAQASQRRNNDGGSW